MSQHALTTITASDCLVGYHTYIKLLGKLTCGKEVISYGMTQEIERARQALKKALEGKAVSVISSGDPGVYGMAGVVLELLKDADMKKINIEIVPGIISATSCAARLGAPLANDFAVISLSDLLTDWKEIRERLDAAARSNFVIVLYNPKSKTRNKPLARAWNIIKKYRSPKTPVGIVRNAYRDSEAIRIISLKETPGIDCIDMATTIIIGNSGTYIKGRYMITPRGYNFRKRLKVPAKVKIHSIRDVTLKEIKRCKLRG